MRIKSNNCRLRLTGTQYDYYSTLLSHSQPDPAVPQQQHFFVNSHTVSMSPCVVIAILAAAAIVIKEVVSIDADTLFYTVCLQQD